MTIHRCRCLTCRNPAAACSCPRDVAFWIIADPPRDAGRNSDGTNGTAHRDYEGPPPVGDGEHRDAAPFQDRILGVRAQ